MLQLSTNKLQRPTAVREGNEGNYPGYFKMGVWGMREGARVAIDYSGIRALSLPNSYYIIGSPAIRFR